MIDVDKIQNKQIGKVYKPLYVEEYTTIEKALKNGNLQNDSELIVFQIGSLILAFSKHLMAFHHIAEGYLSDKPYMLTFCVICNSGMVMNPEVNGKMLHFYVAGVYNGMLLMADKESGSYWDHITGKGLLGKYENHQLEILQPHQVLLTKEVIEQYPNCNYGKFLSKVIFKISEFESKYIRERFLTTGLQKIYAKH